MINIKRVYEQPSDDDGKRVLVDRLWPRGLSKERAEIDQWAKEVAPSDKLRKWFKHDPKKWEAFRKRYRAELEGNLRAKKILKSIADDSKIGRVTLLYGARSKNYNNAIVLKDLIVELAGTE